MRGKYIQKTVLLPFEENFYDQGFFIVYVYVTDKFENISHML